MEARRRIPVGPALLIATLWAAAMTPAPVRAQADNYPVKPVRVIVPFPPGGSLDFNARPISDKLTEALGQQLIVDNRSGASGTIGTGIAARSAPDGYTLLITPSRSSRARSCSKAPATIRSPISRRSR